MLAMVSIHLQIRPCLSDRVHVHILLMFILRICALAASEFLHELKTCSLAQIDETLVYGKANICLTFAEKSSNRAV